MKTYNDFKEASNKEGFILTAIAEHKASPAFMIAADAEMYDRKQNVTILKYKKLLYDMAGKAVPDNYSANHKVISGYFPLFMTELAQYLLGNGVTLDNDADKKKLGNDFDIILQQTGRAALVEGVAFGYWNFDHLESFKLTEFVPLYDEENGALMAGIRFWQIDLTKPMRATLYEMDGFTEYIQREGKRLEVMQKKRSYKIVTVQSEADGTQIYDGGNYPGFPIVPLWANPHHQSELVGLREGIDCYDLIKSGFANDIDDASLIYWTLENAGGMTDIDLAKFVERMKTVKAAVIDGDGGAKAEAHTMDVPYAAREAMLERLRTDLYRDAQVLDVESISAGAKTATEIRAAYQPMDNKTDQFEYCVIKFLRGIFTVAGIENANPTFTRSKIANVSEDIQNVMMGAEHLSDEYLTRKVLTLLGDADLYDEVMQQREADEMSRIQDKPDDMQNQEETENEGNNQ